MLFLLSNGCPDIQFVIFYKIAPVTIFLSAAGIKFVPLNFIPRFFNLAGYEQFVFRTDIKLLPDVRAFAIRFNKIKFGAYHMPVTLAAVHEKLVKNGLSPVIATPR